jgi:hypothetical protein
VFLFSRPALEPNQSPIQWAPSRQFQGIKQLGRETDRSPPSTAGVKNVCSYVELYFPSEYAMAQLVQALRYMPECCGFDSRWVHGDLSLA